MRYVFFVTKIKQTREKRSTKQIWKLKKNSQQLQTSDHSI